MSCCFRNAQIGLHVAHFEIMKGKYCEKVNVLGGLLP